MPRGSQQLRSPATLREALFERPNSLNLVRLFLAASVVVWHAWPLGHGGERPGWVYPLGLTAVPAFFCLSGFLIARSRMRLSLGRFLWHRALRIFPALWVVLLLTAFVAAPLSLLEGGIWRLVEAVTYVRDQAMLESAHGSIAGTVDDEAWNGSLWSLYYEVIAYVCAGLLLLTAAIRRHALAVTSLVMVVMVCHYALRFGRIDAAAPNFSALVAQLVTCYLAGMVMYFASDRLRVDIRLAAVAAVALVGCWVLGVMHVFGAIPLTYLLLWAGAAIPARWAQRDDISYGVYIYAFPVQVMLEWFAPGLPLGAHIALALLFTGPLAFASWRLIERPAMRLRHVSPGRRKASAACEEAAGARK